MSSEIITKQDLHEFGEKLLKDIKDVLGTPAENQVKYLKSYQVRNMLKISPGTLQNLRVNGTLRFTKLGSILYYNKEDILKLLEGNASKR